jgi:hypothetical protein
LRCYGAILYRRLHIGYCVLLCVLTQHEVHSLVGNAEHLAVSCAHVLWCLKVKRGVGRILHVGVQSN